MKQSEIVARYQEDEKRRIDLYVEYAASFQRVFNNEDGKKVMFRLKMFLKSFNPDPYQNAYNTAIREIVDFIERQCDDVEYQKYLERINAQNKTK